MNYSCRKKTLRFIQVNMTLFYETIISVLESGINSLDDLGTFDPILYNLGRRHGKLELNIGFRLYYCISGMFHISHTISINSEMDRWNSINVDNVIILWRHLISGICKTTEVCIIANRCNVCKDDART
uniref:GLOBIN domain-containing protein n=1 Tax=Elaeophora elaphi TaxID=1147741 RepID=A0A0R3S6A3_9BILA